jgi:alkylation response protein AidB-like acyl-CoA dehydrogenase
VVVLYAQTEAGAGGAGIAAFLVDGRREGFHRADRFELTSQHTIGAGGFELRNYQVRKDELLQPAGKAFKVALRDINGARIYVGAMCCGMVDSALKIAAEYGARRTTFGRRLGEHQGWRWSLGEADIDLTAARQMVQHAAAMIDADEDAQFAAAKAKIFATRMAERHLPALAQLMGAEGLRDKYPFGRHLIGARIAGFVDGSTEMLLERLTVRYTKPSAGK